jgi:phosphoglycolate phosphatase-like HAD superfamily hydrolase
VVWDVDGTLIPADLRWLRRAIGETFGIDESAVVFPRSKVHGYTDESIVVDTAIESGIPRALAESGIARFRAVLINVMTEGREELSRVQPPYPGAVAAIKELHRRGFVQTVLTGNLRAAAEIKLAHLDLNGELDLDIGGFGSDARDRFDLPDVIANRFREKYGEVLPPRRTVVIGDAPNDIACARHAGFWAVVVTHRTSREELASYQPDAILDSLNPAVVVSTVSSLIRRNGKPGD